MLGPLDDGGRVDDLAAHVLGGGVDDGEVGRDGVGAVDDAAVDGGLGDLRGDLLDVGAVGDHAGSGQVILGELVVGEDLLGVLAHGHVGVAHGELDVAGLEVLGEVFEAVDVLGVAIGDDEGDLVLEDVEAGVVLDEVKALLVVLLGLGVKGVHLLLAGGDEDVALGALLDLGLEGARGIEVEGDLDALLAREGLGGLGEALGHGGGGEDGDGVGGSGLGAGGLGGGGAGAAAADKAETGDGCGGAEGADELATRDVGHTQSLST